jgi:hypothetical protein
MGTEEKPATLVEHELVECDSYELVHVCVYNYLFTLVFFFFFFFGRSRIDWPIINCFWEYGALLNRSTSLDPSGKIEITVHPYGPTFFSLFT